MNTDASTILEELIASEDAALEESKEGDFYPSNHHLIHSLLPRADTLLSEPSRRRLYFHLLRLSELPAPKDTAEFSLLPQAYREIVPLLALGPPACRLPRITGLLLFGYDDNGSLAGEPECTLDAYRYRAEVWKRCNEYAAIPYMLANIADFTAYASDEALARRILDVLRHVGYAHTPIEPGREQHYPVTRLWFWALVLLTLMNPATASDAVEDLVAAKRTLPRHAKHMEILARFLDTVGGADLKRRLTG